MQFLQDTCTQPHIHTQFCVHVRVRMQLPPPSKSLNRTQYMDLVTQNMRAEQELLHRRTQHLPSPKPIMTIDLTEDNDADLQASRRAWGEEQVGASRRACLCLHVWQGLVAQGLLAHVRAYTLVCTFAAIPWRA